MINFKATNNSDFPSREDLVRREHDRGRKKKKLWISWHFAYFFLVCIFTREQRLLVVLRLCTLLSGEISWRNLYIILIDYFGRIMSVYALGKAVWYRGEISRRELYILFIGSFMIWLWGAYALVINGIGYRGLVLGTLQDWFCMPWYSA